MLCKLWKGSRMNDFYSRDKFWMVVGKEPASVRHNSRELADAEAERLARRHPGQVFTVVEAIASVVKGDVTWMSHSAKCEF